MDGKSGASAGESGALFDAITEAADGARIGVAITGADADRRNLYINKGAADLLGYQHEELFLGSIWNKLAPEEQTRWRAIDARRSRGEAVPLAMETTFVHKSGRRIPVEVSTTRVVINSHPANVSFFFDIADRKQAEQELRSSERRFRSLIESAPDGVAILQGGHLAFANPTLSRMLGLGDAQDAIGLPISDFLLPEKANEDPLSAELDSNEPTDKPVQYRVSAPPGREATIEMSTIPIEYEGMPALLGFARDVTERNTMQARLIQADRLAAVGMLAAGVAHEINNPLAYVLLNLHYLTRELPKLLEDPSRLDRLLDHVEEARHGAQRVQTIVQDLRTFARADEDASGPVNLIDAIEAAINIAEHEIRHRAQLRRDYRVSPVVSGNAARLEQVFLNLLVNATQALEDGRADKDCITIKVTRSIPGLVQVEVADTGPGVDPEILGRIFDPFFTTKPAGVGTGLGLSICRSIINGLGGEIEVHSAPNQGTQFRVALHEFEGDAAPRRSAATPIFSQPPLRRGRILIVDDETSVGRMLATLIEEDHDVDFVPSGAEALEALQQKMEYDAILCDLMMPGMTGMDLYAQMQANFPKSVDRVIFMTGGAFLPDVAAFLETVPNPTIEKPFDLDRLRRVLKTLTKVPALKRSSIAPAGS